MLHQIIQLMLSDLSWCFTLLGCIAIWKPKGVHIAKKYLKNSYENNPEGAGFAICKDNKIEIHKGFFNFKKFWTAFKDLQRYPALVHFRIATHGEVNEDNCHPFEMLEGKMAMIHNGILPLDTPKDKSDSKEFADEYLTPLLSKSDSIWEHPKVTKIINKAIGSSNKVVVMRSDGKHWIFNEKEGDWFKGAWFSNWTYKYSKSSYNTSVSSGYYTNVGYGCYKRDENYWAKLTGHNDPELAKLDGDNAYAPESKKEKDVDEWIERKRKEASVIVSAAQSRKNATDVEYNEETKRWEKSKKCKPVKKPTVIKSIRNIPGETYNQRNERLALEGGTPCIA